MNKSNLLLSFIFILFCLSISSQDYDVLIQNGHVIDVKNKIDDVYDIAISKNKIVSVEKKIEVKKYFNPLFIRLNNFSLFNTFYNHYKIERDE